MHARSSTGGGREPFRHELAVGWREVRSRRWVWMTILNVSLALMLYVAPFDVVGPIVAKDSLGGATAWGLIGASFAAGMAAGRPLGYALTGPVIALVGQDATLIAMAASGVLFAVWMLAIPDIRRIGERKRGVSLPTEA